MNVKTKVRKIGNSYGIILSKETLETLCVKEGDTLYLTESPQSTLQISSADPQFEEFIRIAEEGMQRYHNALCELAK